MSGDERIRLCFEAYLTALEAGEDVSDLRRFTDGDANLTRRLQSLIDIDIAAELDLSGATASAPRLPMESIGDFKLIAPIGSGGMGKVFIAEQQSLRRLVAIKILDHLALGDANARKRFRREAEIAASLDHPNIVPIYAVGEDSGVAWIAMRWLSGPGLDAIERPVAIDVAAKVGMAAAHALDEAHKTGIIHRDVKPANIIVNDGVPIVVDFGLAKQQSDVALTKTGVVPGTLPYMAPELLRERGAVFDPRIDIYALGATLYELLSGRPPFPETDTEILVKRILLDDPLPLHLTAKDRDLETIILRALDKDPARRFATAGDMAQELGRFLRGDAILSRRRSLSERAMRFLGRRKRAVVAVLSSAVVFGGLAAWSFGERKIYEAETRARTRAECDAAAGQIERSLEADDLVRAQATLRSMTGRIEENDRLGRAARALASREAFEALLDRLQDRPDGTKLDRLERLIVRCEEKKCVAIEGDVASVALALAMFDCGRKDDASRLLATIPDPAKSALARPIHAVTALIEGKSAADLRWPESAGQSIDASILTVTALRRFVAADAAVEAEIAAARSHSPTHYRTQIAYALFLTDKGKNAEAFAAFAALGRSGRNEPLVRRNLARAAVLLGKIDEAERQLAAIGDRDDPLVALLEYEIAKSRGREPEARAILETAEKRWPSDPEFKIRIAQDRLQRATTAVEFDAVRELAVEAMKSAFNALARDQAMSVKIASALRKAQMTSEEDALEEAIDDAKRFLSDDREPTSVALVALNLAVEHYSKGQWGSAFAAAKEIVRRKIVAPVAEAIFVVAFARMSGASEKSADSTGDFDAVISVGRDLLQRASAPRRGENVPLRQEAISATLDLLFDRRDFGTCRALIRKCREIPSVAQDAALAQRLVSIERRIDEAIE